METIAWIGFSQGLFAAILIMTKKERSVSDRLLVAWLSLLSIEFLTCAIDYRYFGYPLLTSSFILFNPAFYLYVKSLVNINYKLKWVHLLHLVPFIFFEILTYILHEPYSLGNFLVLDSTLWFRSFFSIASVVSWVAYNFATANSILKHRSTLVNEFSNIESYKKVGWLLFIVIFYNLYCFTLVLVSIVTILKFNIDLLPVYNYSALLLLVYILGFYGLKQQVIYKESPRAIFPDERYSKSQLTADKKSRIKSRIINYFEKEKPFLNPELSMDVLSESLKIPKHHLTEVLNVEIGKNFFQFVNEYRVEAVKIQLMDPNNLYSIEAIGYDCGFSSKSSFFTVFKRITGKTPQEYRNTDKK